MKGATIMNYPAGRHPMGAVLVMMIVLVSALSGQDDVDGTESSWPREINVTEGTIVLYQPQLESLEGTLLAARAAVSVTPAGRSEPVFGAVWIEARLATDAETREVSLDEVKVTASKFPDVSNQNIEAIARILEKEIPAFNISVTYEELVAGLELIEDAKTAAENYGTVPPRVIVTSEPTVLVFIDGEAKLQAEENTSLMRVVNSPHLILLDQTARKYFLSVGSIWYSAQEVAGPWKVDGNPPQQIVSYVDAMDEETPSDEETPPDEIPVIHVAFEPTELIVTEGAPTYSPLSGTGLLYVSNTEAHIFLNIESQQHFVLLSGRWYRSGSLEGPWVFVSSDSLPADFAAIPPESEKGEVLASVAGTVQAKEAVLETQIPQTASIDRAEATCAVEYDGQPEFVQAGETTVYYAVNTSSAVFRVNGRYYVCDNAVWFESSASGGPWEVCVVVPEVIYTIPPSCPHYNVRYVYVYHYTPAVVYTGYTPGYVGCYVYGPTVIYGTGYYYRPWYGVYYYPRPVTFGFSFRYNPYTGWSMGVHMGVRGPYGYVRFGYSRYPAGWWGPPAYRPPYHRPVAYRGQAPVNANRNVRAGTRNLYNSRTTGVRSTGSPAAAEARRTRSTGTGRQPDRATQPRTRENNIYTDRNGNVYRRNNDGWEQRTSQGWSSGDRSQQPTQRDRQATQNTNTRNRSELERQHSARQRGSQRSMQSQRSRPTQRPSGGRRR